MRKQVVLSEDELNGLPERIAAEIWLASGLQFFKEGQPVTNYSGFRVQVLDRVKRVLRVAE